MGSNQYLENIISKEEVNEIISMYNNNVSLRELEKRVPYSRQALARMLERLGAKTTSGNHYRKYFFDFNFFEKIDSEIKAYWLGFMYADGCVLPDKRKNNSWYFSLGGNLQVIKAYHLLYDNKTRFMDRKYQKFQLLLQKYGENHGI